MTFHRGKVHNYLKMTIDYTEGGTFKVSMIYYIDSIIAAFNDSDTRGHGIKTSAAPEDLYKFYEDCENLSSEKANIFHNIVSNTLYTNKRARPYICTLVAFLTTRVR